MVTPSLLAFEWLICDRVYHLALMLEKYTYTLHRLLLFTYYVCN
jgi:hypothetical protein